MNVKIHVIQTPTLNTNFTSAIEGHQHGLPSPDAWGVASPIPHYYHIIDKDR